jgi:predicted RNase H-like HicB family nuclease
VNPNINLAYHVSETLFPGGIMTNEFTAIIEKEGDWYIAYCPEVPGANSQGRTIERCKKNLADAISLILEDRRQDAIRGLPEDAIQDMVSVS